MKGIIVEIRGTHAAALSDEGCIIRIRNKNYAIGQVIEMEKRIFGKPVKTVAMAAAAAALTLMFGVSAWAYCTPYTYVSLDVNPSIEYSVNRFGRVLSAKAVDQDAVKVLEQLRLKNQSIDDAVRSTVQQIDKEGYFQSDDPGGIVIATYSENEQNAEELATDLQDTAEQGVSDSETPVEVESVSVGYERVQEARTLGTTPGKLNLVEKLQASMGDSDSVDVQEWLKKPVKDIMKAIKTAKKTSGTEESQEVQDGTGTEDNSTAGSSGETASSEKAAEATELTVSSQASKQNGSSKKSASSQASQGNSKSQAKEGEKNTGKSNTSSSAASEDVKDNKSNNGNDSVGHENNGKVSSGSDSEKENNGKSDSGQNNKEHSNSGNGGKK